MMQGTPLMYFSSLNRPFTVMGVERSLFFLILGLCLPLVVSGHFGWVSDLLALGLFVLLHTLGIFITRLDAQFLTLYQRHIRYHRYYAPVTGIHARLPSVKPSVPVYQGQKGMV